MQKYAFIATQGPLPDTVSDFWWMVWEYKYTSIVLLTKEKEGTWVRCYHYCPRGMDMYGQMQVVLVTVSEYSGSIHPARVAVDQH